MSELTKSYLISTFSQLGERLLELNPEARELIDREQQYNAWFTPDNVTRAVQSIGRMLNPSDLELWLNEMPIATQSRKVSLVLAGNIPLVGFHDILCVLASRHHALIKASSQDSRLTKWVLAELGKIAPEFNSRYQFVDRLSDFDAVIATGSNNTSRYFEYYFGRVAHIIRKNRNSVAVLAGNESKAELAQLGHDIFDYFGLGCRNVSKLYVPEGYDFSTFFEGIEHFNPLFNHHKYNNNYDYNKSIYLVNQDKHLDNGFLLVKEDQRMSSPLATLYYERYADLSTVQEKLEQEKDSIQCVATNTPLKFSGQLVHLGESQRPRLWDYADGVNTMEFLAAL